MKIGIVGMPNVGKSTLFNSLTKSEADAAKYPFSTVDRNIGMVQVPDERLARLTDMYSSKKTIPAIVEFVDIAGLVSGAGRGEGLGNQFLSHIREVDAIVHVVRCFEDENVARVGSGDPASDIETVNLELIFSDLDLIERRLAKVSKTAKADKSAGQEAALLEKTKACLEEGKPARSLALSEDEKKALVGYCLLTAKPVMYCANISESDLADKGENNASLAALRECAAAEGSEVLPVCAKIEEEMAFLEEEESRLFLAELGVSESGLTAVIKAGYKLLGLISFLTAGPKETRAWTVTEGTKAPAAAGKIHSDLERGFIRAEVVHYDDLMASGSYGKAREHGHVRIEGKGYVIKDGDVVLVRFNV